MQLYIEGRKIPFTWLREAASLQDVSHVEAMSEYARSILTFCYQWLHGQHTFTLHTSGSTSTPKAIHLTRSQMEASARMTIRAFGLDAADTALVCMNTAYIGGKMMLVRGLEAGMDLTIVTPSSQPFSRLPVDVTITFAAMVPLQVQTMLATPNTETLYRFNALKALIVGGAPVSYALQQMIRQHISAPVYSSYGMTETVSHIALKKINGHEPTDAYKVLSDVVIGTDARDCLTIRGAVTNQQTLTTNDIVSIVDDRHFIWIGRADHVINSGGFKIFPEKVEEAIARILEQQAVRYFIAALPDDRLGEKAVLIIEGRPSPVKEQQALLDALRLHVHLYEVPKEIYYVPQFEMTATEKINRKQTLKQIHT